MGESSLAGGAVVCRCRPDEVVPLRHAVLRPHQRPEEAVFAEDTRADAAHFCARDEEGRVVSAVSVWPEAPPWRPEASPAWRFRAMATAPQWQRKGVGSAVLAALVAHVSALGGGLLWCNARLAAACFYEKAGMERTGEIWEIPVIGPHVAMFMEVWPAGR